MTYVRIYRLLRGSCYILKVFTEATRPFFVYIS